MSDKIYPKGTKVRLYCCTHDYGSEEFEDIVLDSDTTEAFLNEMAVDFMENTKQPESWFEIRGENE
jgi:hypothetical protein